MRKHALQDAVYKAQKFIEHAELLLGNSDELGLAEIGVGTRRSGSVRRASMELTRSLSELRRSGRSE